MKLEDLPIEVLALILSEEVSFAAVELWKCGSGTLRSKLARGGIIQLHSTPKDNLPRLYWPKCVDEFSQLKSFSFSSRIYNPGLDTAILIRKRMLALPSTLKRLHLHLSGSISAFFLIPPGDDDFQVLSKARSTKRRKLGENDVLDTTISAKWSWDPLLPVLEDLKLGGDGKYTPALNDEIFATLPRSLLSLDLDFYQFGMRHTMYNFGALPPNLTKLLLPPHSINVAGLRSLPSSITDIGRSLTLSSNVLLMTEPNLLPNLLCLPTDLYTEDFPFNLNTVQPHQWASNILTLKLHNVFPTSFPPRLTLLSLDSTHTGCTVTSEWIENLPRTIHTLELYVNDFEEPDSKRLSWPPSLTDLTLVTEHPSDLALLYLLPRNLKIMRLVVGTIANLDFSNLMDLGQHVLENFEKEAWTKIREELMEQSNLERYGDWKVNEYISAVENGSLFGLPLSLTEA